MAKSTKQKLFENMGRLDPSFNTEKTKKAIKEWFSPDDPPSPEYQGWEVYDWTPGDLDDSTVRMYDDQHGAHRVSVQDMLDVTSKNEGDYAYWTEMTKKDQNDPQLEKELDDLVNQYGDSQNWGMDFEYDGDGHDGGPDPDYHRQLRRDEPDYFGE